MICLQWVSSAKNRSHLGMSIATLKNIKKILIQKKYLFVQLNLPHIHKTQTFKQIQNDAWRNFVLLCVRFNIRWQNQKHDFRLLN